MVYLFLDLHVTFNSDVVQVFISEVFALPLAYTLTVILASLLYIDASSNYLTGVDDDYKTKNTADNESPQSNLFFLYVLAITGVFLLAQYFLEPSLKRGNTVVSSASTSSTSPSTLSPTSASITQPLPASTSPSMSSLPTSQYSPATRTPYTSAGSVWVRMQGSLENLLSTTGGYLVGCGWYTWSVLTFQVPTHAHIDTRTTNLHLYPPAATSIHFTHAIHLMKDNSTEFSSNAIAF